MKRCNKVDILSYPILESFVRTEPPKKTRTGFKDKLKTDIRVGDVLKIRAKK